MPLRAACLGEGLLQSSDSASVQLCSLIPVSDPQVCRIREATEFSGPALRPSSGDSGLLHSSNTPLGIRTLPDMGPVPRLFPDSGKIDGKQ